MLTSEEILADYNNTKNSASATLVAQWEFDGNFIATNDSSYDGNPSGSVEFVPGQVGLAASFDGGEAVGSYNTSIDYVDSRKTTPASYFNGGFSVMGWIKPEEQVSGYFLDHDESCCTTSAYGFGAVVGSQGTAHLTLRDSSDRRMFGESPIGAVPAGTWSHVALTWNGSTSGGIKIYVNGQETTTNIWFLGAFSGLNGTASLSLRIGSTHANSLNTIRGYVGSIDHLSVWKGALSAEAILADYNATASPSRTWYKDTDDDRYSEGTTMETTSDTVIGYKLAADLFGITGDCNDDNASIHPSAEETCDGVDNNCNGQTDEHETWYKDVDNDGYSDGTTDTVSCTRPAGYKLAPELTAVSGDCNDANAAEHPGQTWYKDADNDGYSDGTTDVVSCTRPIGYKLAAEVTATSGDCNDANTEEHPGQTWYKDTDNDGYSDGTTDTDSCARAVGYKLASELTATSGDCKDGDNGVHPGAVEIPNNEIDENCDGIYGRTQGYTPVGANVVVQPVDSTTGNTPFTITFAEVTQSGETILSSSSHGAPPPSGFKLMTNPPVYYELNTTAVFQGTVTICVAYPDNLPPGKEQNLKLFHYEDTSNPKDGILDTWVDVTTSKDMVNNIICGAATSFSPFAVFVQNQTPVADAGADRTVEAVGTLTDVTLDGSGSSDPDGDSLSYTWSGPFSPATGAIVTVQLGIGTHIITLTVDDGYGGSTSDEVIIAVQDTIVPVVSNTVASPNPVAVRTMVTLTATIMDTASNVSALYSSDGVNWSSMNMDATIHMASVTINSGFATSEVYDICVKGTDAKGNESTECIYLPVYDPSAGFVTGGGWIWSPKGAYTRDASLEGKANFGFVAKYKKGANIPEGNTEFQFSTADFNFHSNTYEWLVVSGFKATFKGTGIIEGEEGSHKFMISCVDGDLKGNGAKDTFRIRIWDEDGNGVETTIYDNQMGADMDAEATTTLGGGSIIIHAEGGNKK